MQQTCFQDVDVERVARMTTWFDPDHLARCAQNHMPGLHATEYTLASIRSRANHTLINGHWYRKG